MSKTPDRGIQGIDVSHWQGKIDWHAAKASGRCEYAWIKATEGYGYTDPKFRENWKGAVNAGVIPGAYHFARVSNPIGMDATREARWFLSALGDAGFGDGSLPPVLDIEWDKRAKDIPAEAIVEWCQTFLLTVENGLGSRHKPIVYTGRNFWRWRMGKTDALAGYPLWIAQYKKTLTEIDVWPALFWQYTGSGSVDGIDGNVDRNVFFGMWHDLDELTYPSKKEPPAIHLPLCAKPGLVGQAMSWVMHNLKKGRHE